MNTALFGILFGAALLRSHDLWLPVGLHFGWNVDLPFLGVDLSGLTIRVTGYELVWKAGDLWSGGEYGPEASILTSAVLVLLVLRCGKFPSAEAGRICWITAGRTARCRATRLRADAGLRASAVRHSRPA